MKGFTSKALWTEWEIAVYSLNSLYEAYSTSSNPHQWYRKYRSFVDERKHWLKRHAPAAGSYEASQMPKLLALFSEEEY